METLQTIIDYYHYMVGQGLHPIRVIMRKDCYEEVLTAMYSTVQIIDTYTSFMLMGMPVHVIYEGFYWKIETEEEEKGLVK